MYRPKIEIALPHKLALDSQRKTSCLLLALSQLMLGANLVFIYGSVPPMYLLLGSIFILMIEKLRKQPLAKEALKFCAWRVFLHTIAIGGVIAIVMLQNTDPQINSVLPYWNFLIFTLTPLSIYDGFALAEGKLGLTLKIKPRRKK